MSREKYLARYCKIEDKVDRPSLSNIMTSDGSHLHYDILLNLFRYLDKKSLCRCSMVCKIWKQAAYHISLWSGQAFETPLTGLTDQAALSLNERGKSVVSVNQEWLRIMPTYAGHLSYPYDECYGDDGRTHWKIRSDIKVFFTHVRNNLQNCFGHQCKWYVLSLSSYLIHLFDLIWPAI